MNRKTISIAVSILLALGVTACSGGSGGSDNAIKQGLTQDTTDKPNVSGDSNTNGNNTNSDKKKNDLSPRQLTPEELEQEKARKAAEEAAKKAEEQAARDAARKAAEEEAAKKDSVTTYFANNDSAAYAAASEPTARAAVTQAIDSRTGTCDTGTAPTCYDRAIAKGTVLATQKQAYSSFATLRETFNTAPSEQEPVNSYVYLVATPTTDVAAVVDANYIGMAKFSSGNRLAVIDSTITLAVRGSKLTGAIYTPSASLMANLNESDVKVINGMVGFKGQASFVGAPFGLSGAVNGTYKGVFAGPAAEEVVGTFESDSTNRNQSIQGAFAAAKQ